MSTRYKTNVFLLIASLTVASAAPIVNADDIEVFNVPNNKPQILLLLDYSQSMRGNLGGSRGRKIDVLRETMSKVINNNKSSVEFGLGPMFAMSAGGIQWPVSDPEADAHSIDSRIPAGEKQAYEVMIDILYDTDIEFGTATVPSLVEAVRYYQGGPVEIGGVRQDNTLRFKPNVWNSGLGKFDNYDKWTANPAAYDPQDAYSIGTAPGSTGFCKDYDRRDGAQFCPDVATSLCSIESDELNYDLCQYEHADEWRGANYVSPIDNACQANYIVLVSDGRPFSAGHFESLEEILDQPYSACDDLGSIFSDGRFEGNCGPEVAAYLANNDMQPGITDSKVITHTVGFSIEEEGTNYLTEISDAAGGTYFPANSAQELENTLTEIIEQSTKAVGQFSNFGVDVNRGTFSHDNRVYIPMFQPSSSKYWSGNVKGYYLDTDGLKDVNNEIAGQDGAGGFIFSEEAQSFWSSTTDGSTVVTGGASGALDPANRNLLTYTGTRDALTAATNGIAISATPHKLDGNNNLVTPALLGVSGSTAELLDWIQEQPMGAPLHSNTVIANYPDDKRVVYAMTNQGFLHAIDGTRPNAVGDVLGGQEIFAFMPQELLPNINYMMNGGFTGEHLYGLDGQITPLHTDENNDGIVNGSDKLVLVFGMRRGGSHYYALDVTDSNAPKLMWQISGGSGDFSRLAQSWSKPSLVTVKAGNSSKRVLVFGGGYDDSVDDLQAAQSSNGNTVFMVDDDGDLIWSASHTDMTYAIPSDVTVIDSDSDGMADRAYVGDLGSQVWRIDFDDVDVSSSFNVSRLADLSGQGYRPIFYKPSVSRETSTGPLFIGIGTGNRDNPLTDNARGALYSLTDSYTALLNSSVTAPDTITHTQLYDATDVNVISTTEYGTSKGWYIQLDAGEKALSAPLTVEGKLLATTFVPTDTAPDPVTCAPASTTGRLYVMNIDDAASGVTSELNSSNYVNITGVGIPPSPSVIFAAGSEKIQIYVGNQEILGIDPTLRTQFWHSR